MPRRSAWSQGAKWCPTSTCPRFRSLRRPCRRCRCNGPVRGLAFFTGHHTIPCMLRYGATILSILLPSAAFAQAPVSLHASYDTYAAGLHVAKVETGLSFGPWSYQMDLRFHTTGVAGLFVHGHQFDVVSGSWQGLRAEPSRFVGQGSWHGIDRLAEIDAV